MSDKLTIAMLSIHSSPIGRLGSRDTGGMSVYILESAKYLGAMGHRVVIFTLGQGEKSTRSMPLAKNVILVLLALGSEARVAKENVLGKMPEIYTAFKNYQKQGVYRFSLLHSNYWLSGVLGEMLREDYDIPHCITFHTLGAVKNMACENEAEPAIRIEHERMLAHRCHRIIAFTDEEKRNLVSIYDAPSSRVRIVSCGVNSEHFKPVADARSRLDLGICESSKLLLFVGRIVPIKGLEVLLDALNIVICRYDVTLLLIGGEDKLDIEKFTNLGRGQDNEKMPGVVSIGRVEHEELPLYFSAADALIVPSLHESFCLVALEALACGTPVIGSAVGALPLIVAEGAGIVLQRCNAVKLAEAIENLIIHKTEHLLSRNEIRNSVESYSWKSTSAKLQDMFIDAVDSIKGAKM